MGLRPIGLRPSFYQTGPSAHMVRYAHVTPQRPEGPYGPKGHGPTALILLSWASPSGPTESGGLRPRILTTRQSYDSFLIILLPRKPPLLRSPYSTTNPPSGVCSTIGLTPYPPFLIKSNPKAVATAFGGLFLQTQRARPGPLAILISPIPKAQAWAFGYMAIKLEAKALASSGIGAILLPKAKALAFGPLWGQGPSGLVDIQAYSPKSPKGSCV